jgi:uncharacterized membrane protein YgcG
LKKIEDILASCIEDIRLGRSTLEGCIQRYPSVREELEPLLRIAIAVQELPPVKPTESFKSRAKVHLMEYIHSEKAAKRSWSSVFGHLSRPMLYSNTMRRLAIGAAILVAVIVSGAGTAYASHDSLPGDILYPVKIGTEQFRRLLETDDVAEVELELAFAGTRLAEVEKLANRSPYKAPVAIIGYEKSVEIAIEKARQITDIGVSDSMLELVALTIVEHISALDRIEDGVSESATKAIRQAEEITVGEQIRVLRLLAQRDPLRAAEMNIYAMQNRLQRASSTADKGEATKAEVALQQFTQLHRFGEEITEIARVLGHGTTAVDELNAGATRNQMEVLGNMCGKVSDDAMASVEEVMGISVDDHVGEGEGSPENGAPDDIPGQSDNLSEEPGSESEEPGSESAGSGGGSAGSGGGSAGSGGGSAGSGGGR